MSGDRDSNIREFSGVISLRPKDKDTKRILDGELPSGDFEVSLDTDGIQNDIDSLKERIERTPIILSNFTIEPICIEEQFRNLKINLDNVTINDIVLSQDAQAQLNRLEELKNITVNINPATDVDTIITEFNRAINDVNGYNPLEYIRVPIDIIEVQDAIERAQSEARKEYISVPLRLDGLSDAISEIKTIEIPIKLTSLEEAIKDVSTNAPHRIDIPVRLTDLWYAIDELEHSPDLRPLNIPIKLDKLSEAIQEINNAPLSDLPINKIRIPVKLTSLEDAIKEISVNSPHQIEIPVKLTGLWQAVTDLEHSSDIQPINIPIKLDKLKEAIQEVNDTPLGDTVSNSIRVPLYLDKVQEAIDNANQYGQYLFPLQLSLYGEQDAILEAEKRCASTPLKVPIKITDFDNAINDLSGLADKLTLEVPIKLIDLDDAVKKINTDKQSILEKLVVPITFDIQQINDEISKIDTSKLQKLPVEIELVGVEKEIQKTVKVSVKKSIPTQPIKVDNNTNNSNNQNSSVLTSYIENYKKLFSDYKKKHTYIPETDKQRFRRLKSTYSYDELKDEDKKFFDNYLNEKLLRQKSYSKVESELKKKIKEDEENNQQSNSVGANPNNQNNQHKQSGDFFNEFWKNFGENESYTGWRDEFKEYANWSKEKETKIDNDPKYNNPEYWRNWAMYGNQEWSEAKQYYYPYASDDDIRERIYDKKPWNRTSFDRNFLVKDAFEKEVNKDYDKQVKFTARKILEYDRLEDTVTRLNKEIKEIHKKNPNDITEHDKDVFKEYYSAKLGMSDIENKVKKKILSKLNPETDSQKFKRLKSTRRYDELNADDKLFVDSYIQELKFKKDSWDIAQSPLRKKRSSKSIPYSYQAPQYDINGLRSNSIYDNITSGSANEIAKANKYYSLRDAIAKQQSTNPEVYESLKERFNMMGGSINPDIARKIADELNKLVPSLSKVIDFSVQRLKLEDVKKKYGEDSKKYKIMEELYNEMVRLNQKGIDYRKFESNYDSMFGKGGDNGKLEGWRKFASGLLIKASNAFIGKVTGMVVGLGNKVLSTINNVIMKTVKMAINPFKKSVNMFSNAIKRAGGKSKTIGAISELLLMPIVLAVEYTLLPVLKKLIPSIRNTTEWVIKSKDKFEQLGKVLGIIASRVYDVVSSNFILSFSQLFKTLEDNSDWINDEYNKNDTFFDKVKNAGVDLHNISGDFSALSDVVKEANEELVNLSKGEEMGTILNGFVMTIEQALTNSLNTSFESLLGLSKNQAFDLKGIIAQGLNDGISLLSKSTELGSNIIKSLNDALTKVFNDPDSQKLLTQIRTNIQHIIENIITAFKQALPTILPILWDILWETKSIWGTIFGLKTAGDVAGSAAASGIDYLFQKRRNKKDGNNGKGTTGTTVPTKGKLGKVGGALGGLGVLGTIFGIGNNGVPESFVPITEETNIGKNIGTKTTETLVENSGKIGSNVATQTTETLIKNSNAIGSNIASVATETLSKDAENIGKTIGESAVKGGKSLLKSIPLLGVGAGLMFTGIDAASGASPERLALDAAESVPIAGDILDLTEATYHLSKIPEAIDETLTGGVVTEMKETFSIGNLFKNMFSGIASGIGSLFGIDDKDNVPLQLMGMADIGTEVIKGVFDDDMSKVTSMIEDRVMELGNNNPLRQPQTNDKAMNLEQTFNISIDPTNNSVTVDKQEKGFGDSLISLLNRFNINGAV